jgi:hypothetical protein
MELAIKRNMKLKLITILLSLVFLTGVVGCSASDPITDPVYITDLHAPTGRTATYVIAASDAPANVKAQADYVCDGISDNVQIQLAITALTGTTGSIHLSQGTFSIASSVILPTIPVSGLCIDIGGEGKGVTILSLTSAADIFTTNGADIFKGNIHDITFYGANQVGSGINAKTYQTLIYNNKFDSFKTSGITHTNADSSTSIYNNEFGRCGLAGTSYSGCILLDGSTAVYIHDNDFGASTKNIKFKDNSAVGNVSIFNNHFGDALANGIAIEFDKCDVVRIYDNYFSLPVADPIDINIIDNSSANINVVEVRNNTFVAQVNSANPLIYINRGARNVRSIIISNNVFLLADRTIPSAIKFDGGGGSSFASGQVTGNYIRAQSATISVGFIDDSGIAPLYDYLIQGNSYDTQQCSFVLAHVNELGSPLQNGTLTAYGTLTGGAANAILFAWHDPNYRDIFIKKVVINITTADADAANIDCGIADDAIYTNGGTEFFDDLTGETIAVYDSVATVTLGKQTVWVLCQDSASATDGWVVAKILTNDGSSIVGSYYIEYVGK